jgi:hypothetical protein
MPFICIANWLTCFISVVVFTLPVFALSIQNMQITFDDTNQAELIETLLL